jgi:uncharacterized membrane protein YraQ (UPF0718 family)/YHS domain-containing protein
VDLLGAVFWLDDIGRSLREAFFMFWETLWPLVAGFGLSGMVQAFVSRESLQEKMGNHRPASVARATGYGMASSSCSYAASAMAKSLFVKGADFISTLVFMFASTNLVIELGIVLVVLMGWQFALSEFVGGFIMIVLLVMLGGLWLRGRMVVGARDHVAVDSERGHRHGEEFELQRQPWARKLRSKGAWADSASYTIADLSMVRKELVVGYVAAGFLTTLIPSHLWNAVLLHGHGFWTSVENVVVGPFIALLSCVCSVGNVPLAATLWHGGISFGGVISFLFADLIALPLVLIYRRYYGTVLSLRMLAVFWGVMALAGLLCEGLFRAAGLVPTTRPSHIVPEHFAWNYTSYLNLTFLVVFGLLVWASHHRERLGGAAGSVRDPVCGMQVLIASAPTSLRCDGEDVYFCSDRCAQRFAVEAEATPSSRSHHSPTS